MVINDFVLSISIINYFYHRLIVTDIAMSEYNNIQVIWDKFDL